MAEQWLVAPIKRNLPLKVFMDLSMELRKLPSVDEIRNVVNIYRHDHRIGFPRGVPGAMLVMTEIPPPQRKQFPTTRLIRRQNSAKMVLTHLLTTVVTKQTMIQNSYMQYLKVEKVEIGLTRVNSRYYEFMLYLSSCPPLSSSSVESPGPPPGGSFPPN